MHKLVEEYKASLKDTLVEETVDLFLFRPIAFGIVKLIYRFPITPNQISFLSMLTGIVSGIFFALGDPGSFMCAGILYALTHILDCCDGMVARLKKNGTPMGRIIDGWVDYITSVAVYTGLLIGLLRGSFQLPLNPWLMMIPASISLALHCMMVDYYRHEFMAHALGKTNPIQEDRKIFSAELEKLKKKKGKYIEKLMIIFYLHYYTKLQVRKTSKKRKYHKQQYYQANKLLLSLWNWIGLATHIFVLIAAALLYEPMIFFYYILGLANLWMLVVGIIQIRTNKRVLRGL